MATLCIDAGTTLIKAVVFSDEGHELAITSRKTHVLNPSPSCSEQNMDEVWESVQASAIEAISIANQPISAISVTAQGDGAWMVDHIGNPIGNAILWNDGRASEEVELWESNGVGHSSFKVNGSLTSLGLPNAIMAWLKNHEPEQLRKCSAVLTCGSWIYFKLTEVIGQHISEASAPWIDLATKSISNELIELYGLTEFRDKIPNILDSNQAPLSPAPAESLSLPAGIPVIMAPYDILATATGSGVLSPGKAFAILGTTICPGVITNKADRDGVRTGLNLVTGQDNFLRAFPTLNGTTALTWAKKALNINSDEELTRAAQGSIPGANGLMILPYFSPAGERAPFLDPRATASFHGLTANHSPEDIARAFFESLCHVIRECLEVTNESVSELAISGGGAQSDFWCQLIADVVGLPVTRTKDAQIGAKGAQIYAAVETGRYPNLSSAAQALIATGESFTPNIDRTSFYDLQQVKFVGLRKQSQSSWESR